jgi:hypothetical protein
MQHVVAERQNANLVKQLQNQLKQLQAATTGISSSTLHSSSSSSSSGSSQGDFSVLLLTSISMLKRITLTLDNFRKITVEYSKQKKQRGVEYSITTDPSTRSRSIVYSIG